MELSTTHNLNDLRPTAIDLFAGAGGLGLGFMLGGFDVPLSVEIDQWACDTLRYNHPKMGVLQADIRDYQDSASIKQICPQRPDVIIGGPPCQGFSIAGPAKKDPSDPRNSLFTNFARWVEVLQPQIFVMENVKGILGRKNGDGQKVITIVKQVFSELGYQLDEVWVLNAAHYGVPQIRERIFIVGHRLNKEIEPPPPICDLGVLRAEQAQLDLAHKLDLQPPVSLWDAISDLPPLEAGKGKEEQAYMAEPINDYQQWVRKDSKALYNHVAMSHSKRLVERFKHIQCGMSVSDVPVEHGARQRSGNGIMSESLYDQNNRRLFPDKPSHTIAAAFYANFLHPFQHRNLTAREGARAQSFPDSYRFMGKKTVVSQKLLHREGRFTEKFLCQYNQIGNAVPPLLAQAIAIHLKQALNHG